MFLSLSVPMCVCAYVVLGILLFIFDLMYRIWTPKNAHNSYNNSNNKKITFQNSQPKISTRITCKHNVIIQFLANSSIRKRKKLYFTFSSVTHKLSFAAAVFYVFFFRFFFSFVAVVVVDVVVALVFLYFISRIWNSYCEFHLNTERTAATTTTT